jgi:hypothetical protein
VHSGFWAGVSTFNFTTFKTGPTHPQDSKLHTHSCENLKAHKTLTLAEKISLLQDLDKKSESKGKLALKYSIPNSSLSSILKNHQEIEEDFYN